MFFLGIVGIQCVFVLISCIAIAMLDNYYKGIDESIAIYTNPRAYKPQQRIKVLEQIVKVINPQADVVKDRAQVQKQIKQVLEQQKIGCFAYKGVLRTAMLGKYVMVVLFGILVLWELYTKQPLSVFFMLNTMSMLMSLFVLLVDVVVNVSKKRRQLYDKLTDYITHGYAAEKLSQKERAKSDADFEGLDAFSQQLEKENNEAAAKEVQIAVESVLKIFE